MGRGSKSRAFGLPGIEVMLPFESPAKLHCHRAKLVVGCSPVVVSAHPCSHSLSLHACHLAKTGWNTKAIHAKHQISYIYNN